MSRRDIAWYENGRKFSFQRKIRTTWKNKILKIYSIKYSQLSFYSIFFVFNGWFKIKYENSF